MNITSSSSMTNSTPKPLLLATCRCGWSMIFARAGQMTARQDDDVAFLVRSRQAVLLNGHGGVFHATVSLGTMSIKCPSNTVRMVSRKPTAQTGHQ